MKISSVFGSIGLGLIASLATIPASVAQQVPGATAPGSVITTRPDCLNLAPGQACPPLGGGTSGGGQIGGSAGLFLPPLLADLIGSGPSIADTGKNPGRPTDPKYPTDPQRPDPQNPGGPTGPDPGTSLPPVVNDPSGGPSGGIDPRPLPPIVGGGGDGETGTPQRPSGSTDAGGRPLPPRVGGSPEAAAPQANPFPQSAGPVPPVVGPQGGSAQPRATTGAFVPDEILAVVNGGTAVVEAIAAAQNLQVRNQRSSALLGATIVTFGIPDGRPVGLVLAQVQAGGQTLQTEPNHLFGLQQAASIPQYSLKKINLDPSQSKAEGIKIGVIDSAAEFDHPALAKVIAGYHDALPQLATADREHGTSIVGLIAGHGTTSGAGLGAQIYLSRAFEGGNSSADAILRSLDWAAGNGVQIINMSFAGPRNNLMERACAAARARGIVLVAAAGNQGPGAAPAYPAASESVIAVTATGEDNKLMPLANRGAYVFVAAPGVDVAAPIPGGTGFVTGTSMASAIVSGGIATLMSGNGKLGSTNAPDLVEAALAQTAVDLGEPGRDGHFGHGLADFAAAARY